MSDEIEFKEYRNIETVKAYPLEEGEKVVTSRGIYIGTGEEYLIHGPSGNIYTLSDDEFELRYEEIIPLTVEEVKSKGKKK